MNIVRETKPLEIEFLVAQRTRLPAAAILSATSSLLSEQEPSRKGTAETRYLLASYTGEIAHALGRLISGILQEMLY